MARNVSLIITLLDGGDEPRATLVLNTTASTWTETEAGGGSKVFTSKHGKYSVLGETAVILTKEISTFRVGRLTALDPAKVKPKDSGQGLSDEAAGSLSWVCERVS